MDLSINTTYKTFNFQGVEETQHPQKSKKGAAKFTLPDLDDEDMQGEAAGSEGAAVIVAQLPAGYMTDEQLLKYQESQTAPKLFDFVELYEQFGIELKWNYDENGRRISAQYDDTPANRAKQLAMQLYMDDVTREFAKTSANTGYSTAYDLNVSYRDWISS